MSTVARLAVAAVCVAGVVMVPVPAQAVATCQIAAAGDVAAAGDYKTGAARTARQIKAADPQLTLALGDLAYDSGTVSEFRNHWRPTWGQIPRLQAVAGNHEYRTAGADGMEAELGELSNDNRALTMCGWRIVLLNPYKGINAAALYLRGQQTAYPSLPKVALWHAPRFSSGSHGSNSAMQPLWEAARDSRTRIVLSGHDHNYERFAPMTTNGSVNYSRGTRQFVSGLGGHGARALATTRPNSQKRYSGQPGVLFLTLRSGGAYAWSFRTVDGVTRDSGSRAAL